MLRVLPYGVQIFTSFIIKYKP